MDTFDIALCQYGLGTADTLEDLVAAADALFDRAGDADLYILPELFLDDLTIVSDDPAASETAVTEAQAARFHEWVRAAARERDAVVVGGSYCVEHDGEYRNRAPIATPDEFLTWDKRHPTPRERDQGRVRGRRDPPVVTHEGVGVGVVICYDVEFPETTRAAADAGAEVLAVPSWSGSRASHLRVRRSAAARAIENQQYVAHTTLVGKRNEAEGTGRSAVYAPCDDVVGARGTRLMLPPDQHAAATCTVDVAALRRSRAEAAVTPYTDSRTWRGLD